MSSTGGEKMQNITKTFIVLFIPKLLHTVSLPRYRCKEWKKINRKKHRGDTLSDTSPWPSWSTERGPYAVPSPAAARLGDSGRHRAGSPRSACPTAGLPAGGLLSRGARPGAHPAVLPATTDGAAATGGAPCRPGTPGVTDLRSSP